MHISLRFICSVICVVKRIMFTKKDTQRIINDKNASAEYRGMYSTYYNSYAFESQSTEENIIISRAPRTKYNSNAKFWLAALQQETYKVEEYLDEDFEECFEEYVSNAQYKEISESDTYSIIKEYCSDLITKPALPLNSKKFIGALVMYYQSGDQIIDIFMEYEDEYLHFYWESTA